VYHFTYTESIAGRAQQVTRQSFNDIIRRPQIADICARIAAAQTTDEVSRLKRQLPAICWHAWFDDGVRKNSTAHPSGLVMIDIDHIDTPPDLWQQLQPKSQELGILAAHITPSGKGLRLVFPAPAGMDLVTAQSYYINQLSLQNVDTCTKDLARLSFCVPQQYWLMVDEERLFGQTQTLSVAPSIAPSQPPRGEELIDSTVLPEALAEAEHTPDNNTIPTIYPDYYETAQTFDSSPRGGWEGAAGSSGSSGSSIPYHLLVEKLQDQLGGIPAHGSRNNYIFTMAAHLRYVCDDNPHWIAQILPTYGEAKDKWWRTIQSACQRAQHPQMPILVKRAIALAHKELDAKQQADRDGTPGTSSTPPPMPHSLPRLIAHLVKNVPVVCRPSVANAVFPALATHLYGVKFWLIDGTEKEATFMCVNMAKQSSGKSAINKPIEYIVADIVERDELSRQREQQWKESMSQRASNKEKPPRPNDLCVQVLVSDMTNAAFVQRMKDADGRYLYTNLEELELLRQLQTNGSKDVGKIICLCFDNGTYGQERVGTQSVTGLVGLRWNWNASSTIQKGKAFFKSRLVDGTLSRINLCTIVPDPSQPFVYGHYDERYADELKPYIDNLNAAQGNIRCPRALTMAREMLDRCLDHGALADDEVYRDFAFRAVTIAYLKAMVLYIAHGMKWSRQIADFAQWSLDYDLWCKMHFFGPQIAEANEGEQFKATRGRQNLLDLLPDSFTEQQATQVRLAQGMTGPARFMLNQWVYRGYVVRDEVSGMYVKTDSYLKRAKEQQER